MNNLTDQQKSVLLAKAMGWQTWNSHGVGVFCPPEGPPEYDSENVIGYTDLYYPTNMALARKVFRWAYDHDLWPGFPLKILVGEGGWTWGLDKIFELCVEVGIIDSQE